MANPDFNIWYKSFNESFLYINERSNIKDDWLDYKEILNTEYANSIIKPINKYFYKMCPPPELISIIGNTVTLCQKNFAEIFLLKSKDSTSLRAMEKIHMRQFYLSKESRAITNGCFNPIFRWSMPWLLDYDDILIKISEADSSPFYFYEFSYTSKKLNEDRIDPPMLFFKFKNSGNHMVDEEYGRIKRKNPAYIIEFSGDDIMIERIKEFYGKN